MYVNAKMRPVEIIPGMGDKGEWMVEGVNSSMIGYIWYIARTFVNATLYPHPTQQWK
jgi:hypothetical protein